MQQLVRTRTIVLLSILSDGTGRKAMIVKILNEIVPRCAIQGNFETMDVANTPHTYATLTSHVTHRHTNRMFPQQNRDRMPRPDSDLHDQLVRKVDEVQNTLMPYKIAIMLRATQ